MADHAKEIKEIRRELSDLGKWVAESVLRVEALRRTLDQKALAEFEKHLSGLKERGASIRAKKASQSLAKILEEFHGPKQ